MHLPTVLVVEPDRSCAVGRLGDWLADAGLLLDVRSGEEGAALPAPRSYSALVVMGGSMGAYDDEAYPWLPAVRDLLRVAVGERVPTLGICLGGQLLAGALGGRIRPGDEGPEIGPALVAKRDAAAGDRLFGSVPFTPDVLQWHWDVVDRLPDGATLLASSTRYPNQAFRVGETAWGTVFHVETVPEQVRGWIAEDTELFAEHGWDLPATAAHWDLDAFHADLAEVWQPFAQRFAEMARERDAARR